MGENREAVFSTLSNKELRLQLKRLKRERRDMSIRIKKFIFIRNLFILFTAALVTLAVINRSGAYPWGSDTFGHLFKGNILYDAFKDGKLFLNYHESWYNGIQPFRYWAPLPYYILALINLVINNIITTFNVFVVFIFLLGGSGWLLWGYYTNRQNLCLVFAVLWFFVPDNLRVLFSEGNIPFVIVNSMIPFIFLYYYKSVHEKGIKNLLILSAIMFFITLNHAMITAMIGLSLFIFALFNVLINRNFKRNLLALVYAFLGIMVSSFWLYPALKGGIMGIDSGAVSDVMKSLTYHLTTSLNPMLRFENIEIYYFGIAFAFAGIFGLLFSTKNERAAFITAIMILLGTTKAALPLLEKLPMNQLFWMRRFTAIAIAMIILGLILWKNLRKGILWILVVLLAIDSAGAFYFLGFNRKFPSDIAKTLDDALSISTQRIGVLDSSSYGSFPSYYIAYNSIKPGSSQVYGWAWQGATTAKNIVALNTALEDGYYLLMFDRALELGADVLVVKKSFIKNFNELNKAADTIGYKVFSENNETIIYKYPVKAGFGTRVQYDGIAVGRYSSNAIYIFPNMEVGESEYIDDYSYEELCCKKVVYLSGFKCRDKQAAEELLLKLSRNGIRVVIDATGLSDDEFLGVRPQTITINDNYHEIYFKNNLLNMRSFPEEYKEWKTCFLTGIQNKESYAVIDSRLLYYMGTRDNGNLVFIGLNLPYYTFLTKDEGGMSILKEAFNMEPFKAPKREVHKINYVRQDDMIKIKSNVEDIVVPLAAIEGFAKVKGDYDTVDNLIHLKSRELELKIVYPHIKKGVMLSAIFICVIACLSIMVKNNEIKKKRRRHRRKR